MGGAEDEVHSPKVRNRWHLVSWPSFVEAVGGPDLMGKKDASGRRPTPLWTLAGMAAVSALFIYLIQCSVMKPYHSPPTSTSQITLILESSSQTGVDALKALTETSLTPIASAVVGGNRKIGGEFLQSSESSIIAGENTGGNTASAEAQASLSSIGKTALDSPKADQPVDSRSKSREAEAQGSKLASTDQPSGTQEDNAVASPVSAAERVAAVEQSTDGNVSREKKVAKAGVDGSSIENSKSHGDAPMPKVAHVFISTDETDLRPIFVVINSTLANAKHPENVDFNLVMPKSNEPAARSKLLPLFPGVNIDINRGDIDSKRIESMITYKEGTGARRELVSVFNFIPFYLPFISRDLDRIVYLDADVVVVGDIAELAEIDMEGKAAAAVEDCMQMFKTYFDFKQLAEIQASKDPTKPWMPHFQYDKKACVFNRGVLLIDVQKWIQQNMTETIEWWMQKFSASKVPLYKFGLSQPPFLLALYERYKKLDRCWNTRGLGRDAFGEKERDFLARIGFGRPPKSPFLSPWADTAKIMHFNGKYKPWRNPRIRPEGEKPKSLCGEAMMDCAELWWRYMDAETHRKLTPPEEASKPA